MYAKRVQIVNYGPIEKLDITFPFESERPKPVLLVGENGSGKSILLSHIVNGLISAKDFIYPETPEVNTGKVYKLRSNGYIKSGEEFYFGRADFENGLYVREMRTNLLKNQYDNEPSGFDESIRDAWNNMDSNEQDYYNSSISNNRNDIKDIFSTNCILYFPSNRFEEPAWLNEENLKSKANYMDIKHISGYTDRRIINYSPLHENQNWLFDLLFDGTAFKQTRDYPIRQDNGVIVLPISVHTAYSGQSTNLYNIALSVMQQIVEGHNLRFGVDGRHGRVTSVMQNDTTIVPNIFQLSTGQTSLLNIFLSILRDFDLSGAPFTQAEDIRGIVVVDEIDLHLHTNHQYRILPSLIKMFPKVQFIFTTHSPLFVLGMRNTFGEDGFSLYRMPDGQEINPEEFAEFESAYRSFSETDRYLSDVRKAIEQSHNPVIYMEGGTDVTYTKRAAQLLSQDHLVDSVILRDGGGEKNLDKIWNAGKADNFPTQKTALIYDGEVQGIDKDSDKLHWRKIPFQESHPIKKGVENLFSKETLQKAIAHKSAFIDIVGEHTKTERGEQITVPETWTVNNNEKTNLCNWLCDNGTAEDFQHFRVIFRIIDDVLSLESDDSGESTV